jgi:ferrochelatase
MSIDHLLVIGFGGPPRAEDVRPFLQFVAQGAPIPPERLAEVERHYHATGGGSPYNAHTQRLVDRLRERLREDGVALPVFLGLRNWHPFLQETIRDIAAQRLSRGLGIVLAPHRSEVSYERYRRNVEEAMAQAAAPQLAYTYLRPWHEEPGFIEAQADRVRAALAALSPAARAQVHLLFSAHSIPVEMARRCQYEAEYRRSCELVAQALGQTAWSLAYQSRSGSPRQPWLEPDVETMLERLQGEGVRRIALVPIGFLSDHTEVLYDLDVEAQAAAQRLGMAYVRASTVMDHPAFVAMLSRLAREALAALETRRAHVRSG